MKNKSYRIVHITTVHSYRDPRILLKECRSAVSHGFDTHLIAPDVDKVSEYGVFLHKTWNPNSRIIRVMFVVIWTLLMSLRLRADIYHFHDPELMGVGFILSWLGNQVIYDVHEDYETSIRQKKYLPFGLKQLVVKIYNSLEQQFAHNNQIILAEKYYRERLSEGVTILNYPPLSIVKYSSHKDIERNDSNKLLYTGNITVDRGALIHASLVELGVEVYMVGKCTPELANKMKRIARPNQDKLQIYGVGFHVPFYVIEDYYKQQDWLAGLAILPNTPHYKRKELTKFFEYMGSGLPIIYSDFPVWHQLIDDCDAGIAVNPNNFDSIQQAVNQLKGNPDLVQAMRKNGIQAIKERYNWESQEKKLISLYQSLLH